MTKQIIEEIGKIAKVNDVDMGVAKCMLRKNLLLGSAEYKGADDIDYAAPPFDVNALETAFAKISGENAEAYLEAQQNGTAGEFLKD